MSPRAVRKSQAPRFKLQAPPHRVSTSVGTTAAAGATAVTPTTTRRTGIAPTGGIAGTGRRVRAGPRIRRGHMRMMGRRMQRVVTQGPTAEQRVIVRLGRRHQWRRQDHIGGIRRQHGARSVHGKSMIPIAGSPWAAGVPPQQHHQEYQGHDTGHASQEDQEQHREHDRRTMLPLSHSPQVPRPTPSGGASVLTSREKNRSLAPPLRNEEWRASAPSPRAFDEGTRTRTPTRRDEGLGGDRVEVADRVRVPPFGLSTSTRGDGAARRLAPPSKPTPSGGASVLTSREKNRNLAPSPLH